MPLYARHGIPATWLADVNARAVDIHTDPIDGVYTNVRRAEPDDTLAPTAFPEVVISVRDSLRMVRIRSDPQGNRI